MSQSRSWTFTLNNPEPGVSEWLKEIMNMDVMKRFVAGFEVGEKGTPHIQGAFVLKTPWRFNRVRDLMEGCHIEEMIASWKKNLAYCSKSNDVLCLKDTSQQGKRKDLEEFKEAIESGASDLELYREHTMEMAKYPRFAGGYKAAIQKDKSRAFRKVEVTILHGDGGMGKSKMARYDENMNPKNVYVVPKSKNLKWWSGYDGEDEIVIEEFDWTEVDFAVWKTICDGHQIPLETKGGFAYPMWTKVWILSNDHPDTWWGGMHRDSSEFKRRVTKMIEM